MAIMGERERIIIRTSTIGIVANVFLAIFKAAVGLISNSIAVTLDAVNNLSDAASSIITIIGARLASKKPDREHPMGHGRVEYLSSLVVAAIVLYAGLTAGIESVKKIITPEEADYGTVAIIIMSSAIVVKLVLGTYVKRKGQQVNSGALMASGSDALFDAILSGSVLASAVIFLVWGISLEAYVGVVISLFIIKAGIEMMSETIKDIIGRRGDAKLSAQVKEIINEEPSVRGAYDLIMHNYGPDMYYASVHIELPDHMTVDEVDVLTRQIERSVYEKTGVILTGVGVYSYNTSDDAASAIRDTVRNTVMNHDWALQFHGFYVDMEKKAMRFDVVVSFDMEGREAVAIIKDELAALYGDYDISIVADMDMS